MCPIIWDRLSAISGCLGVNCVNIYWLLTVVGAGAGAGSLEDHQEMRWYPLEKYHTQIPKNA